MNYPGQFVSVRRLRQRRLANSPYELNLDRNQTCGVPSSIPTVDNPFSPSELERVLRPFDVDAPELPDRLAQLTTTDGGQSDQFPCCTTPDIP